jgi:hypothetical protein
VSKQKLFSVIVQFVIGRFEKYLQHKQSEKARA